MDGLRERYRSGVTRVRLVRLYDPDGGVRLVDFAAEMQDSSRALRDLERATAAKNRAVEVAMRPGSRRSGERWSSGSRSRMSPAAGLTAREVRAVLRRS